MGDYSHLPAGTALKTQRLDEWEQMLRRYPLASPWGMGLQIAGTLFGNVLVVWLVLRGWMTPFELVLLVAIEALLLIGIAWLQSQSVPPEAVDPSPMTRKDRLQTLGFLLFWLAGVYSFVFFGFVPSGDEMLSLLRDPLGFLSASSIRWPLLVTLVISAIDAVQDRVHFRRHGGKFLSTPGLQGAARGLTLILGGIPFAVPFFAGVLGLKLAVERIHAWYTQGVSSGRAVLLVTVFALAIPASIVGGLALLDGIDAAMKRGVDWWALCFGAAKIVSELFIVGLPLIAAKAHEEESAVPVKPSPPSRRSRIR